MRYLKKGKKRGGRIFVHCPLLDFTVLNQISSVSHFHAACEKFYKVN